MVTTRSQTKKKAEEDNKNVEDENVDNVTETKPKKETKKQSKSKKVSNDDYLSMMANEDVDAPVPDEKPKKKSTKKDEKKDDKITDEDQKPEPKKSEKKKKPEPKKKTVESDDEYVADIAPKKKAVKKEPATKGGKKKSNQDDYLQQMYQEQDELELNDEEREKAVSLHDIDQMIDKEGLDSDEEPVKKKVYYELPQY
jgi:ATP-binding cassette subfamily F protein 1